MQLLQEQKMIPQLPISAEQILQNGSDFTNAHELNPQQPVPTCDIEGKKISSELTDQVTSVPPVKLLASKPTPSMCLGILHVAYIIRSLCSYIKNSKCTVSKRESPFSAAVNLREYPAVTVAVCIIFNISCNLSISLYL
jgi:hypothetical protein